MKTAFALVLFLVTAFLPAVFGSRFMPGAWYASLAKPSWTPPGWVFGPVWTVLYVLIGCSGWLAWKHPVGGRVLVPMTVFALQLVLNGVWSWVFFGMQRPGLALVEILVLWAAILATAILFWRIRPLAGALLIPYLLWVAFAATLNWKLWDLNR